MERQDTGARTVALRAEGIRVLRAEDGRLLVDGVDLQVLRGQVTCLVGESGSGKSLTARTLLGLVPRDLQHEVSRFEVNGFIDGPRDHLAYIPQRALSALNPLLRVGTQLVECAALGLREAAGGAEHAAIMLLEEVGVDSPQRRMRQFPHELSGGQRQRVLLAMALIRDPSVIIADEPTTALDVGTQSRVFQLLRERCRKTGLAVLLVTHDLAVAGSVADSLAVMYCGRIVEQGATATVLSQPSHPYTRSLLACTPVIGPDGRAELPRPIPGQMQPRFRGSTGCSFADRCSEVEVRCREGDLKLRSIAGERQVRCLLP